MRWMIRRGRTVVKMGMVAASSTMLTALTVKTDAPTKSEGAEGDLIDEGMCNLICFVY